MIDDSAAQWAARVDRGPLKPTEMRLLDDWLNADQRHLGAYAKACAVLASFDKAQALGPTYKPETFEPRRFMLTRRGLMRAGGATIAASIVGVAGLSLLRPERQISTAVGELRRLPLKDGSILTLNTRTRVAIDFSRSQRGIHLEDGEAMFDVPREQRPFVIDAGMARCSTTAGRFAIRCTDGGTQVLVQGGVVQAALEDGSAPMMVSANMVASNRPGQPFVLEPISPAEIQRRLAWQEGMIAFEGDTLEHAALEFARYSGTRIIVDDPAVGRRRIVGWFSVTNPAGFARSIATSLDLTMSTLPDGVHLRARTPV
jgi:transmembrane sensor